MQSSHLARAGALAAFAAVALMGPALAQNAVTVTVNGAPVNLNPPPTERAGRVFVPLRGVFENLGATVVYANGTINATGRGHTISLHIGSQQAIVDGQNQMVDVAPFIIGASTYVPLRFVSQALGASVNYDGSNNVVAIRRMIRPSPPARSPSSTCCRVRTRARATIRRFKPSSSTAVRIRTACTSFSTGAM